MLLSQQRELYLQKLRYRYLAYCTIRDAVGFYFGIPKFLANVNQVAVIEEQFQKRTKFLETKKARELTPEEAKRCRRSVEKTVLDRIALLQDDFLNCKDVLFTDNIWLQLLDLSPEFLQTYLCGLQPSVRDELAVVPNWTTRDHSLGRPYIGDKMSRDIKF